MDSIDKVVAVASRAATAMMGVLKDQVQHLLL